MAGISSVLDRLEDLGDGIDDEGGEVESSGCGDDPLDGEGGLRLGGAKLGLGDLWGQTEHFGFREGVVVVICVSWWEDEVTGDDGIDWVLR